MMISRGVPAGASSPRYPFASMAGQPASANVGTSGISELRALAIASARSRPVSTSPLTAKMPPNAMVTSPLVAA